MEYFTIEVSLWPTKGLFGRASAVAKTAAAVAVAK
jgi:hypothetical protein